MKKSKKNKKKNTNHLPLIGISIFALLFGTLIYQFFQLKQGMIQLDGDNCRVDGLFPRDTVVLLDSTEALSESQQVDIKNRAEKLVRDSLLHERFTIYALQDNPDRFKPTLTLCNPGDGQEKSELIKAKKELRMYKKEFEGPLIKSFSDMSSIVSSESSPIMEMLKFVGLRTFARSDSPDKRLILVSDMVEHTDSYSQYRNKNLDFESLSNTPYFREMRPRLDEVYIDLLYIERASLAEIQGSDHVTKFWQPFVRRSGGQINNVTYIN